MNSKLMSEIIDSIEKQEQARLAAARQFYYNDLSPSIYEYILSQDVGLGNSYRRSITWSNNPPSVSVVVYINMINFMRRNKIASVYRAFFEAVKSDAYCYHTFGIILGDDEGFIFDSYNRQFNYIAREYSGIISKQKMDALIDQARKVSDMVDNHLSSIHTHVISMITALDRDAEVRKWIVDNGLSDDDLGIGPIFSDYSI